MIVDKIKSQADVEACVKIYRPQNDESFLPSSESVCLASFLAMMSNGFFVRVLKKDDEIVGFIIGEKGVSAHIPGAIVRQVYYASNLKGVEAYRAVKLLHKALVEFAEKQRVKTVLSQGSFLDPSNIFARILEKEGWERRHYLAVKRLD